MSRDHAMKVLVTGSSGLIGSALIESLSAPGHAVVRLLRKNFAEGSLFWEIGRAPVCPPVTTRGRAGRGTGAAGRSGSARSEARAANGHEGGRGRRKNGAEGARGW